VGPDRRRCRSTDRCLVVEKRWINTAATTRGGGKGGATRWVGGGAVRDGCGGGSATVRSGGDHGAFGCDYGGGRGVSRINGPGFDCRDLECETNIL
jgi:hypothetical protein